MDMTHPDASMDGAGSLRSGRVSAGRYDGVIERMGTEFQAIPFLLVSSPRRSKNSAPASWSKFVAYPLTSTLQP